MSNHPVHGPDGAGLAASREWSDDSETNLLRDVAFNRHSMNDGHHVSPYDNGIVQVGTDGIVVELTQGVDEENFKRTVSRAQRATIGIDLTKTDDDFGDWEEMLQGGLQTALETQVVVFTVQGVSRTCTHQLVRSRRASFHQQSQRASWYGAQPETRMPESVWRNPRARAAFLRAVEANHEAYRIACDEDISYQDARYALGEATTNFIMCEYSLREFINVFAYRGCSMFSWEIVHVAREMRRLLVEAHPWLEPYIKISCEKSGKCTFQGWEQVEGQCDRPEAREDNRTFRSKKHEIAKRTEKGSFRPLATAGAAGRSEAGSPGQERPEAEPSSEGRVEGEEGSPAPSVAADNADPRPPTPDEPLPEPPSGPEKPSPWVVTGFDRDGAEVVREEFDDAQVARDAMQSVLRDGTIPRATLTRDRAIHTESTAGTFGNVRGLS